MLFCCSYPEGVNLHLGYSQENCSDPESHSLCVTKEVGFLQAEGDLALGRLRFLTDSVSRCLGSSCGRKDAHPVFPGLELFFRLLPLQLFTVQLAGGLHCPMKCGLRKLKAWQDLANPGGKFIVGVMVGREVMVALQAGGY